MDQIRSSAGQENRSRSSPSRPDMNHPAGNNGQQRRRSPVGGSRDGVARVDYPGSRADILAGARAEVHGSRADVPASKRSESPQVRRRPDPSPRHAANRHSSPIVDQFSRGQVRRESPGRGHRPDPHHANSRSDAAPPSSRDDPAKLVMPALSDIILRPAVPSFSDHKPVPSSRKYLVYFTNTEIYSFC